MALLSLDRWIMNRHFSGWSTLCLAIWHPPVVSPNIHLLVCVAAVTVCLEETHRSVTDDGPQWTASWPADWAVDNHAPPPHTHLSRGLLEVIDREAEKKDTSLLWPKRFLITYLGDTDAFGLLCEHFWGCCVSHGSEERLQQDSEENNRLLLLFLQSVAPLRTHGAQASVETFWWVQNLQDGWCVSLYVGWLVVVLIIDSRLCDVIYYKTFFLFWI